MKFAHANDAIAHTNTDASDRPPDFEATPAQSPAVSKSLIIIALLAVLCVLYFAKSLILPVLVASLIALFSSPLVRLLMGVRIPRALASILVVAGIIVVLGYLFSLLLDPALRWVEAVPVIGDRLMFELERAEVPLVSSGTLAAGEDSAIDRAMNSTLTTFTSVFAQSTLVFLIQIGAIFIITYFFLAYGNDLMRSVVRAQPNFADKKLTVMMFQSIRDDVSMYILVVSLINIGLGLATAGVLTLISFKDALLWGALATILNFAPYVGPLLLAIILTSVGFAAGEPLGHVFIAPGLFMILNVIEGQFVTPTVLGKRFNINPLLVVLWMFLWGWLWGPIGMLLAIPILMCFKLASAHLDLIGDWRTIFDGVQMEHHGRRPLLFAIFTKKKPAEEP